MKIHELDYKNKILNVCDWPAPFGKVIKEVQVGQFIFVNAYICAYYQDKVLVSFERLINLMPCVPFDKRTYKKRKPTPLEIKNETNKSWFLV